LCIVLNRRILDWSKRRRHSRCDFSVLRC